MENLQECVIRSSADVLKAIKSPSFESLLGMYDYYLNLPVTDERRSNRVYNRRGRLAQIEDTVERALSNEIGDTSIFGSPAVVTGKVYSEDRLALGKDAEDYFFNSNLVFAGITIKNIRGRNRALLRFFDTYAGENGGISPYYCAEPEDLRSLTVMPLLTELKKRAETCKIYTINEDFLNEKGEITAQASALMDLTDKFSQGLPEAPCQIDVTDYVELCPSGSNGNLRIIDEPNNLVGVLLKSRFVEYLIDDPDIWFSKPEDFRFGNGAPCLIMRDLYPPLAFHAIPVDSIVTIELINLDDPDSWRKPI